MTEPSTNRDLYAAVADLVKRKDNTKLPLRDYLQHLRHHARPLAAHRALSTAQLVALLEAAFEPAGEPSATPSGATEAYRAWDERVAQQIDDLDAMKEAGMLDDDQRYFGVDAPRGSRWYNFDPGAYLECGIEGAFGGWQEEGADTGRTYVQGPVAELDEGGQASAVDPRVHSPMIALAEISWEMLVDFADAGQMYE